MNKDQKPLIITQNDSDAKADYLLDEIERKINSLSDLPSNYMEDFKKPEGVRISLKGNFNWASSNDEWFIDKLVFSKIEEISNRLSCSGYSPWKNNTHTAGDKVKFNKEMFECTEGVTSPWCKLTGYQPGSIYWSQAWTKLGECQ